MFLPTLQAKLIAGGLALLLLVGGVLAYGSYREGLGVQRGEVKQLEVSNRLLEAQEQRFREVLAGLEQQNQQLLAQLQESARRDQLLVNTIQSLQAQRATVPAVIERLPDSAVKADLELKLGGPLEEVGVLRRADVLITEHPLLKAENDALGQQVVEIRRQVDLQGQRVTNLEQQRDAVIGAFNTLKEHYVQAYNVAQQPKRRWYCAWICKTKDQLPFPSPLNVSDPLAGVTGARN